MKSRVAWVFGVLAWLIPANLPGAVSLAVTKPPVAGGGPTGPNPDPFALQGQWLIDDRVLPQGQQFVRSHEFHDNIQGQGGGGMNHLAIQGQVINRINPGGGAWQPGQPIGGFTVRATVTNDTPGWAGSWLNGGNSHGETRMPQPGDPYVGALVGSWLTIEFALSDLANQPAAWVPPYTQWQPEIIATNEDGRAWYCYNQLQEPGNPGNYFVPAWEFGTIPVGQSVTRDLTFVVNGAGAVPGIMPGDVRYGPLSGTYEDILMNRTTDLKIGDWVDVPAVDNGAPYPGPYPDFAARSGNASVFHVPEAAAAMLGLVGAVLLLLRRRFTC